MVNINNTSTILLLITTIKSIVKDLRKDFLSEEITPEQFGMLKMISDNGECIQSKLADELDKDKSAIMRQIDILEEKQLIQRIADATDRRKKLLVITESGSKVLLKCIDILNAAMLEREKLIDEADMVVFRRVLEKLKQAGEA
jgi:DNA-binding MarR family transcriptional regulator